MMTDPVAEVSGKSPEKPSGNPPDSRPNWYREDPCLDPSFQKVAWSVARRYQKQLSTAVLEECVGEGFKRAVTWFNPEKPGAVKFTTALSRFTEQACLNALDKEVRYVGRSTKGALRKQAVDRYRATVQEEVEAADELSSARDRVSAILGGLPPDFSDVLRLYFLEGKTLSQIASQLSLTPEFVSRKVNTALELAKNAASAA